MILAVLVVIAVVVPFVSRFTGRTLASPTGTA